MEELKIDVNFTAKKVKENEGLSLEFKSIVPPPIQLAKLIAGFANAEGGTIICGVEEGRIVGIDYNTPSIIILSQSLFF